MKTIRFATLGLFTASLSLAAVSAQAGDAAAGKGRAAVCTACHGPEGISMNPIWPNIAGQKEQYIIKQLKDFQSGLRKNELMTPIAKTLSETDVANVAAYFSSLPAAPAPAAAPSASN